MAKDEDSFLTDKQLAFCKEYIIDLNATQAAIRAGYSEASAKEIASSLLTKHNIQRKVQEFKDARSLRTEITADKVLKELGKLGFSDIGEFFDEGYSLKKLADLKDKSVCIQSVQVDETQSEFGKTRSVKFRLHDKLKALESIAKHLGFYEKDNNQQNKLILWNENKTYDSDKKAD